MSGADKVRPAEVDLPVELLPEPWQLVEDVETDQTRVGVHRDSIDENATLGLARRSGRGR